MKMTDQADVYSDKEAIKLQLVQNYRVLEKSCRDVVMQARTLGTQFIALREMMERGEWATWIEEADLSKSNVYSYIKLAQMPASLIKYQTSIRQALQVAKPPNLPPRDELTSTEKKLVNESKLKGILAEREKENRELDTQNKEIKRERDHLEGQVKQAEGYEPGRNVVAELNAEVRRLKGKIAKLEDENKTLLKENKFIRERLKKLA